MKNLIIFGAGYYGKSAYYKLKGQFNILYYVDNNQQLAGALLHNIPIISGEDLRLVFRKNEMDIIICSSAYFQISRQLLEMGIDDYYVMLEGFLYHNDADETMMPVEIQNIKPFIKNRNEKNILFVQNTACIRTHKIASLMRDSGYKVYLLYTIAPPESNNESFAEIYSGVYTVYTHNTLVSFVENSEFDIVHSSNAPDILTCLLLLTTKHIVFDTHDMMSLWGHDSIENMTLEYLANTACDGNIYTSDAVVKIAKKKFGLKDKEIFSLENVILNQEKILNPYPKLSMTDKEIHCVYEGGMNGQDRFSDRFFEPVWEQITACGIHIHFYSQSDSVYCKELDRKNDFLHYEGNMGSKELVQEMIKYDCGLAVFNINDKNRSFMETGTANKVYEYINAGLPVVVGDLKSYTNFVEKYGVGISLDMEKDIKEQIEQVCKIRIKEDFLNKNHLTMKSRSEELVNFYECVKQRKIIR